MKKILFKLSGLPLLSLYQKQQTGKKDCYRVLRFSREETERMTQRSREYGAGFLTSAFYLAATARSVAVVEQDREDSDSDILIPVPQDRRKRGKAGPLLGNQTTLIIYRIPRAVLPDLGQCTAELVRQMMAMVRADIPGNYLIMMELLKFVPGPLYRFLLQSPTGGLLGSFFYSDTGDSMQDFTRLFNYKVINAVHYPPNTTPPGMTFIYTRFQGALQVTIGYREAVIDAVELDTLCRHLRADLMGGDMAAEA